MRGEGEKRMVRGTSETAVGEKGRKCLPPFLFFPKGRQRKEEGGFQKVLSGIGQDGAKAMEGSGEKEEGGGSKRGGLDGDQFSVARSLPCLQCS